MVLIKHIHIIQKNLLVSLNLQKNNLNIFYQKKRNKTFIQKNVVHVLLASGMKFVKTFGLRIIILIK